MSESDSGWDDTYPSFVEEPFQERYDSLDDFLRQQIEDLGFKPDLRAFVEEMEDYEDPNCTEIEIGQLRELAAAVSSRLRLEDAYCRGDMAAVQRLLSLLFDSDLANFEHQRLFTIARQKKLKVSDQNSAKGKRSGEKRREESPKRKLVREKFERRRRKGKLSRRSLASDIQKALACNSSAPSLRHIQRILKELGTDQETVT